MDLNLQKQMESDEFPFNPFRKIDELDLDRFDSCMDLFKNIYFSYGPGNYCLKNWSGSSVSCAIKFSIEESKPHVLIHLEEEEDDKLGRYGFDDPGWGDINELKFSDPQYS